MEKSSTVYPAKVRAIHRSPAMLTDLQQLWHRVKVSYDRGDCDLKHDFDVFETEGLHIVAGQLRPQRQKHSTDNYSDYPRAIRNFKRCASSFLKNFSRSASLPILSP